MHHRQERGTRCLLSATPLDGQASPLDAQEHAGSKQTDRPCTLTWIRHPSCLPPNLCAGFVHTRLTRKLHQDQYLLPPCSKWYRCGCGSEPKATFFETRVQQRFIARLNLRSQSQVCA